MIASVASMMVGSARSSKRTSPAPWMTTPRMKSPSFSVIERCLLLLEQPAYAGTAALVDHVDGDG